MYLFIYLNEEVNAVTFTELPHEQKEFAGYASPIWQYSYVATT